MKVTLCDKRDFADVIKLGSCDGDIILEYLGGPNIVTRVYLRGDTAGLRVRGKNDVMMEAEIGVMHFGVTAKGYK